MRNGFIADSIREDVQSILGDLESSAGEVIKSALEKAFSQGEMSVVMSFNDYTDAPEMAIWLGGEELFRCPVEFVDFNVEQSSPSEVSEWVQAIKTMKDLTELTEDDKQSMNDDLLEIVRLRVEEQRTK